MGGALLLDAAAGRDDLLARAGTEANPFHFHGLFELTVGEDLELPAGVDQPGVGHRLGRHVAVDPSEIAEPNDLRLLAEGIGEPAFWQTTGDRHLTALELRLAAARTMVARARLAAFVSLARRLAGA